MKKIYLGILTALLLLTAPSLFAYNNKWADNEDYVVPDEATETAEGFENEKITGADTCPSRTGSPVYVKTGHFTWSEVDIALPGKSGIYFSRSYTSNEPLSGMFGNGWISNLESGFIETVKYLNDQGSEETHYIFRQENGLRFTFKEINGTVVSPTGMYYTFTRTSSTSYSVTDENDVKYSYNSDHIVSKEDANGNKREYIYDVNNVLQSIKDSNTNILTLIFGANGYVTSITDQNSRSWRYTYDMNGNLISVTDPLNGQRNYTYEHYQADNDLQSYYHLTKITDETDKTVVEVIYESGFSGSYAYKNGRVKSFTEGENTYTYNWDYLNNYGYVVKTDALGNWSRLYVSDAGFVTQYMDAYSKSVFYNVDENSSLTGMTDKKGNIWGQETDDKGRIVSFTSPLGVKTYHTYLSDNRKPSTITSGLGHITKIDYDTKNNPTTLTLPDNSTYKATYDAQGNIVTTTNPSNTQTSSTTYNANSQPLSVSNALGDSVSFAYNALGQTTTVTDAVGNITTYTYDTVGHLTQSVNTMGHTTIYTYDLSGRLLSLQDPAGNTTTYQYDAFGRLKTLIRPNGRTLTYTYNTANQLTKLTDSTGRGDTIFTYDRLGQLTKVARGSTYILYYYDENGRMTQAYNPERGSVYFTYNADGQLIQENQHSQAIDYTYDLDGNLATMSAKGTTNTYTRNTLGDLTSLSDGSVTFNFTYDANGMRQSVIYPNSLTATYGLDAASHLTSLNDGLSQNSYTYNSNGLMTQKTVDSVSTNYSYDGINQLASAGTTTYSYNSSGNILNNSATYDAVTNQLVSTATHTFIYDSYGNMIKKTETATGDYKVYTWNDWDQLTAVESFNSANNSTKKITFTYGPIGRRLSKTENGVVEKYLYSGVNMIAIMDNSNNLTKRFIQDEAVDAPLAIYLVSNSNHYYYHRDHLGSVIGISDSSGASIDRYTYDAYGNTTRANSTNTSSYFAFTSREMDDSDLYYYRARYYDPTIGMFLSEDPIGFDSGDFNFYRYVNNNPINLIDPFATSSVIIGIAVKTVAKSLWKAKKLLVPEVLVAEIGMAAAIKFIIKPYIIPEVKRAFIKSLIERRQRVSDYNQSHPRFGKPDPRYAPDDMRRFGSDIDAMRKYLNQNAGTCHAPEKAPNSFSNYNPFAPQPVFPLQ